MKSLTSFINETLKIDKNSSLHKSVSPSTIKYSSIDGYDFCEITNIDDSSDDGEEILEWFKKVANKKLAIFCTEWNFDQATSSGGYEGFFGRFEKNVNVISDEEYEELVDDADLETLCEEYYDYCVDASPTGIQYGCADLPAFFIGVF